MAKLNDALDADAIQIVQSAALLINRWKDAIAIESGVATSESAFGRPNDDPERGEDSVHAPTTAPVVLAEAPSQLRENITTDSKHREVIALSDDVPPKHDDSRRESDLGGPEGAPIARKQFLPDATAAAATHAAKLALEATAAAEAAVRQSQHGAGRQSGDSPNARVSCVQWTFVNSCFSRACLHRKCCPNLDSLCVDVCLCPGRCGLSCFCTAVCTPRASRSAFIAPCR